MGGTRFSGEEPPQPGDPFGEHGGAFGMGAGDGVTVGGVCSNFEHDAFLRRVCLSLGSEYGGQTRHRQTRLVGRSVKRY